MQSTYYTNTDEQQYRQHALYMQRCIQLAALGAGYVAPNPMVGSVLVYNGRIIGEGYHRQYGQAHAEVNCINSVLTADEHLISDSTIYVSLEPCAHFGKTPPCADLIISKKIPKVVVGCRDPFKQVDGKGIEKLQQAGIEVITGVLEKECQQLNQRFFTFHTRQRPYIVLKWAQSADGFIAASDTSTRTFISNGYSNRLVHKWRSEEAAILVGTKTALLDNPSLTNRLWTGNNPVRLVIDKKGILPDNLTLLNGEVPTIVFTETPQQEKANLQYLQPGPDYIQGILHTLYARNLNSVLVEGGTTLLQAFIDAGYWNEARIITNQHLLIQSGVKAPVLTGGIVADNTQYDSDNILLVRNAAGAEHCQLD